MPRFRVFMSVALLAMGLATSASADDVIDRVRSIISSQIAAFINEDADKAFSFAAPALKEKFADPRVFIDMVRKTYAPVYHPGSYAFGETRVTDDKAHAYQVVLISDEDQQQWAAFYEMERQPDGSYAISGVRMIKDKLSKGI